MRVKDGNRDRINREDGESEIFLVGGDREIEPKPKGGLDGVTVARVGIDT